MYKNNEKKWSECHHDHALRRLDYLNKLTTSSQYYIDNIPHKIGALQMLGYHETNKRNFSNAINYYERAYNLAVEIDDIIEFSKITNTLSWYTGKERSAYKLGDLYLNFGGTRDYDKAIKYLTIASEDMYKAWRELGLMHLEGRGIKLDEKKAFEFLKKSSFHGSGFEHDYVADFYLLGLGGQKKNFSKALRHFKLAELGSRGTINFSNIEVLYKYKKLPKDANEFYSWLLENIKKNSTSIPSIERLGYFSNTILKNYSEAYKWYYICSKTNFVIAMPKKLTINDLPKKLVLIVDIIQNQ